MIKGIKGKRRLSQSGKAVKGIKRKGKTT